MQESLALPLVRIVLTASILLSSAIGQTILKDPFEDTFTICHFSGGSASEEIEITPSQWPAHQLHGDVPKVPRQAVDLEKATDAEYQSLRERVYGEALSPQLPYQDRFYARLKMALGLPATNRGSLDDYVAYVFDQRYGRGRLGTTSRALSGILSGGKQSTADEALRAEARDFYFKTFHQITEEMGRETARNEADLKRLQQLRDWYAKRTTEAALLDLRRAGCIDAKRFDADLAGAAPAPVSLSNRVAPPRLGAGHWVSEVSGNGRLVILEDGSLWEIQSGDRINTALWLPTTDVVVTNSSSPVGEYKYLLVSKDDGEFAAARYLGRE
jgi:hypothetical protein